MRVIIIFFTVMFFLPLAGQEKSSIANKEKVLSLINQAQQKYESVSYFEMKVDFILYNNYASSSVTEKFSGFFIKNGSQNYSKIEEVENLQTGGKQVKVFHENKIIEYKKSDTNSLGNDVFPLISSYLDYFSEFEIVEKNTFWRCILKTGAVSMIPYSKAVIEIDKKTGLFLKQELFFLVANEYVDESGVKKKDYPRLELRYSDFTIEKKSSSTVFNIRQYVVENKGKYSPSEKYKEYKLIDLSANL